MNTKTDPTEVEEHAFEIFLRKMPTQFLTEETEKGYRTVMEQAVEIAQLFVKVKNEILRKEQK